MSARSATQFINQQKSRYVKLNESKERKSYVSAKVRLARNIYTQRATLLTLDSTAWI